MNQQPPQPTELEAAIHARDYWYGRAIALETELKKAATYTGIEGYPCPLCTYADGAFGAPCAMHKQIDDLQAENARLSAELAALRAEARWEPVEGYTDALEIEEAHWVVEEQDESSRYVTGWLFAEGVTVGDMHINWGLHENYRLCRLVPGQDGQQQGERSE